MNQIVNFTDAAAQHIQTMLEKEQGKAFRLSLKKTGCSGYAYLPKIIQETNPNDIHLELTNGLQVYIDPSIQQYIDGLVVDYVSENLAGIQQKRLVFINPHEKNRCGCGESFTLE